MPDAYGREAVKRSWLLVCPQFRGPNLDSNPEAPQTGGSLLAQHDIMDAVKYMRAAYTVDPRRIYLVGSSGGGHMACLMACKHPDVFAAATAWCPITDLREWWAQGDAYARHIEAVCGGKPGASPEVDFEYLRRSGRTFITNAANTHLLIGHGDKDQTIYPEQSWNTFRLLSGLPAHGVVFESWSAGHEAKTTKGLDWAADLRLRSDPPRRLDIVTDEAKSYYWLHLSPSGPLTLGRCKAILVRRGDVLEPGKRAEVTELALTTTDVGEVRVDLKALGLAPPATLPEGVTAVGTDLVAHPGAGAREYRIAIPAGQ
jgi:pimeloyl-ACP methyl ester carboxylesterase